MKPIKYPLELFAWTPFDEHGNIQFEVRDADKNFVFYMRIKGREIQEAGRFREELAPLTVNLLNDWFRQTHLSEALAFPEPVVGGVVEATQDGLSPNGVASNLISAVVKRGRGRPRKK